MSTKAELEARIIELEANQNRLVALMDALTNKTTASYLELYHAIEGHNVYFGMTDKNIMLLDGLVNKICCAVGIQLENKPTDLN